nr:MAG TPA: hypothetical protein [Caudoviricetes sp.]
MTKDSQKCLLTWCYGVLILKKCTLTSRSECTKSNETLKETFRLQSYKTFLYLANLYYTI